MNRPVLEHGSERFKAQAPLGDIQHGSSVIPLYL